MVNNDGGSGADGTSSPRFRITTWIMGAAGGLGALTLLIANLTQVLEAAEAFCTQYLWCGEAPVDCTLDIDMEWEEYLECEKQHEQ